MLSSTGFPKVSLCCSVCVSGRCEQLGGSDSAQSILPRETRHPESRQLTGATVSSLGVPVICAVNCCLTCYEDFLGDIVAFQDGGCVGVGNPVV